MRVPWLALALAALGLTPSAALGQTVIRGPYLQLTTPGSVSVRWRTDVPTDSVVRYGTTLALGATASSATPTTEHEITVTGLPAGTKHYYAVGNAAATLAGGDASHFFSTAPTPGSATPTRIWVLGDSGKANQGARDVRDAYQAFTGSRGTDVWLMLGDNAYDDGTDSEFQAAVFDIYPEVLRQVALWPTFGNHDANSASSTTQTGPYYDIFTLPTGAEAGGVASGTEAYYSFDHANVHFICLDSDDSDMDPGSPMLQWLEADLEATDQDWIIAYWHHAPYARGGMDSDLEWHGTAMRQNVLPILEAYGVDVVLAGHDHSYQRSFLVNGHYGLASSFTLDMAVNAGNGREDGDGAYGKPDGFAPHAGAVYTVAGNGASSSSGPFDHPTTAVAMDRLGSVVIDVAGSRLDATFVDDAGVVADYWTLEKGPDVFPPSLVSAEAPDPHAVLAVFSEALDPASLGSPSQFEVEPLETVSDAVLQPDGRSVLVSTSRLAPGTYTLRVSGVADHFGNVIPAGTEVDFVWSAARTMERTVTTGQDDAEQAVPVGTMDLTGNVLELGSLDATPQLVGLRFADLPLPAGATIDEAWVQFQVQQRSSDAAALLIEADAADDAPPFTAIPYDLEARPRTAAAVPWNPPPWKKGGGNLAGARTPELAPLLQEIVDRAGWSPGNAIALVFSGTGSRAASSRDATLAGAALLHVGYTLPLPACSDGIDNDGDGLIDHPLDPECADDEADRESPPPRGGGCGLGPELAGVVLLLLGARVRGARSARLSSSSCVPS